MQDTAEGSWLRQKTSSGNLDRPEEVRRVEVTYEGYSRTFNDKIKSFFEAEGFEWITSDFERVQRFRRINFRKKR